MIRSAEPFGINAKRVDHAHQLELTWYLLNLSDHESVLP